MDLDHELKPELGNPAVPTNLLDLHVELEDAGVDPKAFKEAFDNEAGNES